MCDGGRRCPSSRGWHGEPGYRSAHNKAKGAAGRAKDAGQPTPDRVIDNPDVMPLEKQVELARAISFLTGDHAPKDQDGTSEAALQYEDDKHRAYTMIHDQYGTVEQASTALGRSLAARGEAYAGITGEQIREGQAERWEAVRSELDSIINELPELRKKSEAQLEERCSAEIAAEREAHMEARRSPSAEAWDKAEETRRALNAAKQALMDDPESFAYQYEALRMRHNELLPTINSGIDEQGQQEMRALSDGYQQALAEVRDMGGGTMTWHSKTSKKAQAAFNETASVFPTDWVEHSEADPSGSPVAKIQKSRAHYSHGHVEKTRKREPKVTRHLTSLSKEDTMARFANDPSVEASYVGPYEYDDADEWELEHYEVTRTYGDFDPSSPPRGRGWQAHTYTTWDDREETVWRRPQTHLVEKDTEAVPEIKTTEKAPTMAGRSTTFSTATHEMSHRFEATVPGISSLERQFLLRRTTDPETGERTQRFRIYPRSREIAYEGGFTEKYMGKVYEGPGYQGKEFYELLSTGSEALFSGRYGGLVGVGGDGTQHKADHDMRAFVLGVYATAGRKDAAAPAKEEASTRQRDFDLIASPR